MAENPTTSITMEYERIWEDPEIYVIRVPYIHLGLGHINCYIVRSEGETLVIDPGADTPFANRASMRLANAIGVDLLGAQFACTHLHFDHVGLLKQLPHSNTHILMGQTAFHDNAWNYYELRKALLRSVLHEEGVSPIVMRGLAAIRREPRVCDLPGCEYELLTDGQTIHVGAHELSVISTPGHTSGDICLYSDEQHILFSGDHVLGNMTPGLALPFEGEDSLRDYLISLSKVEHLACAMVLPGHGEQFFDLADRCADLRQRHARRLGQIYEMVATMPNSNGNAIMRAMPWKRSGPIEEWEQMDLYQRSSMGAQTFAYLAYLVNIGEIVREEDWSGRHYHIA